MRSTQAVSPMIWKIRRIAAGLRQQDLAARSGMSSTRYSGIERGEVQASETDIEMLERVLPAISPTVIEELRMLQSL